jgi:UDP-N-acetylmuramoyl-tripeptide--D-alanyl-D-alanine ligase
MIISLHDVALALGRPNSFPATPISSWSVDSRTIEPGALFFALRGPNHDGHNYVRAAFEAGAAAAVVDHSLEPWTQASRPPEADQPVLVVEDTASALRKLAEWARLRWSGEVVAVTGSAGKTTTKEIIAQMLAVEMPVGKSEGNLNNEVGLPLSILRLAPDALVAVLEMGMNHPGELRRLAGVAKPTVGVVTNVGYAHIEGFGSIEDVALAKRELIESLPAQGVAVLNAEDSRVLAFRQVHPGRTITFGFSPAADVHAANFRSYPNATAFEVDSVSFESPLLGRHGVLNVLAGLAVARAFEISPDRLVDAVRGISAGKMRGQRLMHNGVMIFDDCYNANPEAVRGMLDVLRATTARRRVAVLGEMLELGQWSETLHRDIGRYVAQWGIDVLVGIRGAARHLVDEAVRAGMPSNAAYFFDDPAAAGGELRRLARDGDVILFKGSRGTRVERALERFLDES